jgi:hypothetical protein
MELFWVRTACLARLMVWNGRSRVPGFWSFPYGATKNVEVGAGGGGADDGDDDPADPTVTVIAKSFELALPDPSAHRMKNVRVLPSDNPDATWEWLVEPVVENTLVMLEYATPADIAKRQVAASLVVSEIVVWVVPAARVIDVWLLDRTGAVVSDAPLAPLLASGAFMIC